MTAAREFENPMGKPKEPRQRITFFEMPDEESAFWSSMMIMVAELVRKKAGERIPPSNHQVFSHGRDWKHPAHEYALPGEMHESRVEIVTPLAGIVNGNFEIVQNCIVDMVKQFDENMARMFYQTISDACQASGQTLDARDTPFPLALLEMFKKMELGVDRDGKISMPEIHVGSPEMVDQLKAMPPEFYEEFERVKQEKIAKAVAAEMERKKKFKSGQD